MGEGHTGEPRANQRLTVAQAAEVLGITEGAVRSRIKRGTLPTEREGGTVYVLLVGGTSEANQSTSTDAPGDRTDLLIAELQDRVRSLEEANSENRRIIAALTSRIPAIEAPQEPADAPETVEQEPEGSSPRPGTPGQQTGAQRRPWWRRVFDR